MDKEKLPIGTFHHWRGSVPLFVAIGITFFEATPLAITLEKGFISPEN